MHRVEKGLRPSLARPRVTDAASDPGSDNAPLQEREHRTAPKRRIPLFSSGALGIQASADSTSPAYGLALAKTTGTHCMRQKVIFALLALAGASLGGCSTSPRPEGVLPRTDLPPPPSIAESVPRSVSSRSPERARPRASAQPQRQGLSVPDRLVPPRPAASP